MGTYFQPVAELPTVGRRLNFSKYGELVASLKPGERLYGLYDRLIFKLAPHLFSEDEFEAFESQYRSGSLVSHWFYAVTEEQAENHRA